MSPRFVLGQENVPCVAEVVDRSLKADCTDFNNDKLLAKFHFGTLRIIDVMRLMPLFGIISRTPI